MRSLLTHRAIPYKLSELESGKLAASVGEINMSTPKAPAAPVETPKKKVKKAQIAKELWDDISSAVVGPVCYLLNFPSS